MSDLLERGRNGGSMRVDASAKRGKKDVRKRVTTHCTKMKPVSAREEEWKDCFSCSDNTQGNVFVSKKALALFTIPF